LKKGKTCTVLVVDDEPDVSLYMTKVLEQQGFTVLNAPDVKLALQTLAERIPDLVCLDIMMPRESGIALYTHMRKQKRLRKIPVLIVSGVDRAKEFDFRNYMPDTAIPPPDAYLEKPICVDEFLDVVDRLIAAKGRRKTGAGESDDRN
jgi:CheY-like chemotaxis protein